MLISLKWRLMESPPPSMEPVLLYRSNHMSLSRRSAYFLGSCFKFVPRNHARSYFSSNEFEVHIYLRYFLNLCHWEEKNISLGFHISVRSVLWSFILIATCLVTKFAESLGNISPFHFKTNVINFCIKQNYINY